MTEKKVRQIKRERREELEKSSNYTILVSIFGFIAALAGTVGGTFCLTARNDPRNEPALVEPLLGLVPPLKELLLVVADPLNDPLREPLLLLKDEGRTRPAPGTPTKREGGRRGK